MALATELRPLAREEIDTDLLFAEAQARRRRLRHRGAFLAALVVAGFLFGLDRAKLIGSGGSAKGEASGGGTLSSLPTAPIATSSDALLNPYYLDPHTLGDHAEFWYSADGSVEEEYVYSGDGYSYGGSSSSGSGSLISVERSSYQVVNGAGRVTATVVFPAQHAYATYTTSSRQEPGDVFYFSAPFIRRGLADHTLSAFGPEMLLDGRRVIRLVASPPLSGPFGWMDPRDDEIISRWDLRSAGNGTYAAVGQSYYRWVTGTRANLAQLELSVPAGFHEVAAYYARFPWEVPGQRS
jgi:hypothetical protein